MGGGIFWELWFLLMVVGGVRDVMWRGIGDEDGVGDGDTADLILIEKLCFDQ